MRPRKKVLVYSDNPALSERYIFTLDVLGYAMSSAGSMAEMEKVIGARQHAAIVILHPLQRGGVRPVLERAHDLHGDTKSMVVSTLKPEMLHGVTADCLLSEGANSMLDVRYRLKMLTARKTGPKKVLAI
jgi:hypothetical protein